MQIALLETGGTINGILGPDDASPDESRVLHWLNAMSGRLSLQVSAQLLVMKDSRALTDADRKALAVAIAQTREDHILIPHGTYTMPQTGLYLRAHLDPIVQQKSIVMVGSLIPLSNPGSDAPQSLEFAIETLRTGLPGVWIAMNQTVWDPGDVIKDPKTGNYVSRDRVQ
jgi:L-asparaginase